MQSTRHDPSLAALQASTGLPGQVLDVVVLTADAGLLATLRDASGPEHAIWHAPSADVAVDLLVGGRCGILIADLGTLRGDAASLLDRLHAQFPELILMATGRREEESSVAALVGDGRVYRFLHKPISPARAGVFIGTATRRYHELRNIEPVVLTTVKTIASRPHSWMITAALAMALIGSVAFFALRPEKETLPASLQQPQTPAPSREERIADHLAHAQIAYATGRLAEPRGDNALEYFRAVIALQPDHADARAGIDRVAAGLESRVVQALEARNPQQGAIALTGLQRAQPDHPRLDALRAQLLSISRSAKPLTIPRAEGTRSAATRSSAPAAEDSTPPVESTQALAESSGVAIAAPAASESAALEPAVSESPTDSEAASLAASADAAAPTAAELAATSRLRERGVLIEPAGANAYDSVLSLRERYPSSDQVRAEQQRLAFELLERTRTALAAGNVDEAEQFVTRAEILVPGMNATRTLQQQLAAAQEQRRFMTNVVQATSLERLRFVPPAYPRDAQRDGIEGWVDVEFTISTAGIPEALAIRDAQPKDVFDEAALDSVRQWRFEPVMRNQVAVPQRATLRVRFVLE
jgi:TonB family protein